MVTYSREELAKREANAPVWAKCPAFKAVMCHAPWQCKQPCLGLVKGES